MANYLHKKKNEKKIIKPHKQNSTDKDTVDDCIIFASLKLFVCYLLLKKKYMPRKVILPKMYGNVMPKKMRIPIV